MRSGIEGTIVLSNNIFDRWDDLSILTKELTECCEILAIRTGLAFEISHAQLTAAHTAWIQDKALWLDRILPPGTRELSHLKKAALLLSKLCEFVPITVSGAGHCDVALLLQTIQDGNEWRDIPNRLAEKEVRKFKDGGSHYVGWLLAYHTCEFFERHRRDRIDPYEPRITEEFEIDMVSALYSQTVSAQAIHLILKALFLRD